MKSQKLYLMVIGIMLVFTLAACGSVATPTASSTTAVLPTTIITSTAAATSAATDTPAAKPAAGSTTAVVPSSGSSACTNAFFPVSAGATWTYASTGSIAGNYTFVRTLSDLGAANFTVNDAFNAGVTRTVKWTCNSGNLTSLDTGSGNASVTAKSMTMKVDSVNATGYSIPAALDSAKTWSESLTLNGTMTLNGASQGTSVNVTQIDCTANGPESVTVTAGTFDAAKDTCQVVSSVTVTMAGIATEPIKITQTEVQWYARGVGLVKSQNSGDMGNENVELTKYSIP
jgi:hypothetical protein